MSGAGWVFVMIVDAATDEVAYGSGFATEPEARAYVAGVMAAHNVPVESYDLVMDGDGLTATVDAGMLDGWE